MKPTLMGALFIYLLTSVFSQPLNAQCNASFTYTIYENQLVFNASDSVKTRGHYWDFGDGNSSTYTDASNIYTQPGTYTVLHVVYDSVSHCRDSVLKKLTLNYKPKCEPYFEYQHPFPEPGRFAFTAYTYTQGADITQYTWKINGREFQAGSHFEHIFSSPGNYMVCYSIETNSGCSDDTCKLVSVPAKCSLGAEFTAYPDPSNAKLISFSPQPDAQLLGYKWFADEGLLSLQNTFSAIFSPGEHRILLVVTDSLKQCYDTIQKNIMVYGNPSDSCTVKLIYTHDDQQNRINFSALSNQTITSQTWTIVSFKSPDDTLLLSANNPSYNFIDTGFYQVSVLVTTSTGCNKEATDIVHITKLKDYSPRTIASYPNPAREQIKLTIDASYGTTLTIAIYNSMGKLVLRQQQLITQGKNQITIPIQQLPKGQYFADIQYSNQRKKAAFHKF